MIIDTNRRTTPQLACLREAGVTGVIRYYARATSQPEKRLIREEAQAILAAGMSVGVVHEAAGNAPSAFSGTIGQADATYAFGYAARTIGQPAGSAIYFAIDYDCSDDDVTNAIIPHFRAIAAVAGSGDTPKYAIGAYGNGLVLRRLLAEKLVAHAWLSQSTGFREYQSFLESGAWALRQGPERTLCTIGVDGNDANPAASGWGAFTELEPLPTA